MEKQFVTYEIALALKELGYNEQDFGYYRFSLKEEYEPFKDVELVFFRERYDNHNFRLEIHKQIQAGGGICTAPLWQQVIDWFREKYNIDIIISSNLIGYGFIIYHRYPPKNTTDKRVFQYYEEAREQAILKAIELC